MNHRKSRERVSLSYITKEKVRMENLRKNILGHKQRRVMGRQRKTLVSGASSKNSPGTTLMNVTRRSHWWSRLNN